MSNFDPSRLADLQGIDDKLHDYKTTKAGKHRLERSRAAILRQERSPYVKNMRAKLLAATQANDIREVEKINEQLMGYDRKNGYDQYERDKTAKPK